MRRSSGDPTQYFSVIPLAMPRGEIENRGARRKFWVSLEDDGTQWLLKFPRPNTGEHWAEKVAAEIGRLFGINTARVELARAGGELATVCQSFLTDDDEAYNDADSFTSHFHGSEFLDVAIDYYDPRLVRGNRDHNVKTVMDAIQNVGSTNAVSHLEGNLEIRFSIVSSLVDWDFVVQRCFCPTPQLRLPGMVCKTVQSVDCNGPCLPG